jgi:hypothetical protein
MTKRQHKCIDEMNDRLKEHNATISTAIDFSGKERELVSVGVVKLDTKVRKKLPTLFASYCPFCGVALKGMN